jgi:uncharacterized protein
LDEEDELTDEPEEQKTWPDAVQAAAFKAARGKKQSKDGKSAFNYRWEHVQAVAHLAVRLADLTGADEEIVEAAAWLHDIAKGRSKDHAKDGAHAARRVLAKTDFPPDKIDAVADAIAKHSGLSTSEPVEPLEAAILWDADKLSKLGATAVLQFAGRSAMLGQTAEQLIETLCGDDWQEGTLQSFHTAPAQEAGRERIEALQAFCQRASQEFDGDDLHLEQGESKWTLKGALESLSSSP